MEPGLRSLEPLPLVRSAFRLLIEVFQARRASLLVRSDRAREELFIVQALGLDEELLRAVRIRVGDPIAGRVVAEARPLLVSNIAAHPELSPTHRPGYSTPSFASAPILVEGEAFGVVNVADKVGNLPFSHSDLVRLTEFADHLSVCLRGEERFRLASAQAQTDPLTGLLNRRALEEDLGQEIERARRSGLSVCLLMLDLDKFKLVNDLGGHATGDAALVRVAHLLQAHVRVYDRVFRYGGDEFMILMPTTAPEQASVLAQRLQQAIANEAFFKTGPLAEHRLAASIGQTCFPTDGQSPAELVEGADAALYEAKSSR